VRDDLIRGFASLSTGIYVMTVREGEHRHGMSSSWVTQVSATPPLLAAAVDRKHFTHDIVARSGHFALNVVGETGKHLEDYFYSASSRRPDNLAGIAQEDSPRGLPLLRDALVSLECAVREIHATGDHSLFVAEVTHVVWRGGDRPMTSRDLEYVYVGEVVKRPS